MGRAPRNGESEYVSTTQPRQTSHKDYLDDAAVAATKIHVLLDVHVHQLLLPISTASQVVAQMQAEEEGKH